MLVGGVVVPVGGGVVVVVVVEGEEHADMTRDNAATRVSASHKYLFLLIDYSLPPLQEIMPWEQTRQQRCQ